MSLPPSSPSPRPGARALRQVLLACVVLDGLDAEPFGDGVVLRGGPPLEVSWETVGQVLAGPDGAAAAEDLSTAARQRALALFRCTRAAADQSATQLLGRARAVALPPGHALHPGTGWAHRSVHGGVLEVGLGLLGAGPDPDEVVLLPPVVRARLEEAYPGWSAGALTAAETVLARTAAVAGDRLTADPRGTLRPIGDADVLTLLAARELRAAVAHADGTGLRSVAAPMRRRGWLDLTRIDPAFVLAAAAATAPHERGLDRPVLLTADEVTVPRAVVRLDPLVLRDPPARRPALPDVRWR